METFTMRAVCKDVIIAAKAWQVVYEDDGGAYDGLDGCIARAQLSLAVDKLIADEKSRRKARKAARRAAKISSDFVAAANEPVVVISEEGYTFVRQGDGSYACDGTGCEMIDCEVTYQDWSQF